MFSDKSENVELSIENASYIGVSHTSGTDTFTGKLSIVDFENVEIMRRRIKGISCHTELRGIFPSHRRESNT